jgi:hypothetical protein
MAPRALLLLALATLVAPALATPPSPPRAPPCAAFLELAIVLDESGSIGNGCGGSGGGCVPAMKEFAHAIIDQFELGENATRVSITTFSSTAAVQVPLTTSSATLDSALTALDADGWTCISCALTTAYTTMDTEARPGAGRAVLLLTDGEQTCIGAGATQTGSCTGASACGSSCGGAAASSTIETAADVIKNDGIDLFAVGFGTVSGVTLDLIASDPDSTYSIQNSNLQALRCAGGGGVGAGCGAGGGLVCCGGRFACLTRPALPRTDHHRLLRLRLALLHARRVAQVAAPARAADHLQGDPQRAPVLLRHVHVRVRRAVRRRRAGR